jgi:hypothetical protein
MARHGNKAAPRKTTAEPDKRDQEVVRANRELAAYFKGRRTEREARAALKIIKAFVRDRERQDPERLRPLPGARVSGVAKRTISRQIQPVRKRAARPVRRPLLVVPQEGRQVADSQSVSNDKGSSEEST